MSRVWSEAIDAHRDAVRDTVMDATWELVSAHGLRAVSMSQIASQAGIGRATLYRYFPDSEAILLAWHQRQVAEHLAQLRDALERDQGSSLPRLHALLTRYAAILTARGRHAHDVIAVLHRAHGPTDDAPDAAALDRHQLDTGAALGAGARPDRQLVELIARVVQEGVDAGELRADLSATELATYCYHALAAVPDIAAPTVLVDLVVSALRRGDRPAG